MQPDIVKIDREIVTGLDRDALKRSIVRSLVSLCAEAAIEIVAEGVETEGEEAALRDLGVDLMQGYRFGRPVVG